MPTLTMIGCVLMFVSTIFLAFGLLAPLLYWKVTLEIFGVKLVAIDEDRNFGDIISNLRGNHVYIPVFLMFFFGFILPMLKLGLFIMWAWTGGLAGGNDSYIRWVKGLSKWTGVDAILECVIVGMMLKIPGVEAYHGQGFFAFIAYVWMSAIAYSCLPGEVQFVEEAPNSLHLKLAEFFKSPKIRKATLVCTLTIFLVVLSAGLTVQSMRLAIPKDVVQDILGKKLLNRDRLPGPLKRLSEPAMHRIEEAISSSVNLTADTSVAGTIRRVFGVSNMYTVVGSCLVFACVIVFPVMSAVINTAYALAYTELPEEELKAMCDASNRGDTENTAPWPAMNRLRALLWDLSMLDICVVAFALIFPVLSAQHHTLDGEILDGYVLLVLSAIIWHIQNLFCRAAQISALSDDDRQLLLADPEPVVPPASAIPKAPAPIYI